MRIHSHQKQPTNRIAKSQFGLPMTSRERVIKTLTFGKPDRAPRDLWALPGAMYQQKKDIDALIAQYPLDIGKSSSSPGTNKTAIDDPTRVGTYIDEWGSLWTRAEPGVIGEVKRPAITTWRDLNTFHLPWDLIRKRTFDSVNRTCDTSNQFMLSAVTARPFERLQFLRGSEALFIDLAEDTPEFRSLLDMVHEFYLEDIRGWCKTQVDAIAMMDDWGSQQSLLISPQTWRAIFKPLYREYCTLIRNAGKFAFFHTDGFTEPILGDLIEVGMHAINAQLFTMNIERLAKQFKGKVTFWGEIDRQHMLPFGTPHDVRQAVLRVRRALDDGTGGVIAQCEWGIQNPPENIATVFQTWLDPL